MRRLSLLTSLALSIALGACSSVPEKIRTAPPGAPELQLARQDTSAYLGRRIRWGGTITRVENRQANTRIEIVARPLHDDGEPKTVDRSSGRFIAQFDGFLDPAIYASGRRLTVVGTISSTLVRKLGEMDYTYPLVEVTDYHLWPKPVDNAVPYDPWLYDPWYPWHRYPYY